MIHATIMMVLTSSVRTEAANERLSNAAPPPLTWNQLKKKVKPEVIIIMIESAATGEWYLKFNRPIHTGNMFRSASILRLYALQHTALNMDPSCPNTATTTTNHCSGFPPMRNDTTDRYPVVQYVHLPPVHALHFLAASAASAAGKKLNSGLQAAADH